MNHGAIQEVEESHLDNLAHLHSPGREDGSLLMGHDLVTMNPKNKYKIYHNGVQHEACE